MSQYFEHFSPVALMPELTRDAALASGTYVEREGDRYALYFDGKLDRVAYVDRADPSGVHDRVRAEVYTPVTREPDGRARYRTWYVTSAGEVEGFKEFETDADGNYLRESWLDPDGTAGSYRIYRYDGDGELFEVLTYNAAGTLVSREEA